MRKEQKIAFLKAISLIIVQTYPQFKNHFSSYKKYAGLLEKEADLILEIVLNSKLRRYVPSIKQKAGRQLHSRYRLGEIASEFCLNFQNGNDAPKGSMAGEFVIFSNKKIKISAEEKNKKLYDTSNHTTKKERNFNNVEKLADFVKKIGQGKCEIQNIYSSKSSGGSVYCKIAFLEDEEKNDELGLELRLSDHDPGYSHNAGGNSYFNSEQDFRRYIDMKRYVQNYIKSNE